MKRYLNYLLLASNVIVTIFIAVVLVIFLKDLKNVNISIQDIYKELSSVTWIVIAVLAFVLSFGLFCVYFLLLWKTIKQSPEKINPRLSRGLIYSCLISSINYTIPFILFFIGTFAVPASVNDATVIETTWFLGFAFGISALLGLIIAGFTSYFNLQISWSIVRREQLKSEALEENQASVEIKEEAKTKKPKKSMPLSEREKPEDIDVPTSGSF